MVSRSKLGFTEQAFWKTVLFQQSPEDPALKVHKNLDRPESHSPATSLPRQARVILATVFLRTILVESHQWLEQPTTAA